MRITPSKETLEFLKENDIKEEWLTDDELLQVENEVEDTKKGLVVLDSVVYSLFPSVEARAFLEEMAE